MYALKVLPNVRHEVNIQSEFEFTNMTVNYFTDEVSKNLAN